MKKKGIVFLFVFLLTGCSSHYLEKSADKEVSTILEEKQKKIKNDTLPENAITDEISSETVILDLKTATVLAKNNNRTYKSKQEDVYLNILDLTYQRYLFKTRYGFGGGVYMDKGDDESISGQATFKLLRWLATGAQITFDITKNFISYLTGDKKTDFQTIVSLDILQPLLKGAGREIAQEDLIQTEREAVYTIRDFIRYQKSFSIETSEKFLNIILLQKRVENFYNNYQSIKATRERIEMLASAGRIPPLQVDQARQNEYTAYQRWVNAENSYLSALDNFKIFLGLSTKSSISIKDTFIENIMESGIVEPDIDIDGYIGNAIKKRLDLLTSYDRVDDSKRKIKVALNRLKPEVNLIVRIIGSTDTHSYPSIELNQPSYRTGIEFDLPLDKIPNRNYYKKALIDLNRKQRDFENKRDTVILEVYQQYRNLQEYYQSYLTQQNSLLLAKRRVESTDLLLQAGRTTTRDILEAEEAYLAAKNDLATAVVNYLLSYLRFLNSAEMLELDEKGMWEDLYEKMAKNTVEK
ncbi:MAG: TolC family protein [Candidatus Omnitrophica bacterium]|nr:TolC family protein [Candidatus Omnitrophota bacterium]MCM8777354.1 TolC family protein [Candidatus Omnitrophota bacterium]